MHASSQSSDRPDRIPVVLRLLFVLGLLYLFLVAVGLMGGSIKAMGKGVAGADLFAGIANPFAALAVGVLATVLVQSSSTTTATIVGLVGQSGPSALPLATAVPMIMGANIGTTITNTLVSIGHVRQGAEFRRAFAAATVHDFFNLLCVAILLPIELATGFLQSAAISTTDVIAGKSSGVRVPQSDQVGSEVRQLLGPGLTSGRRLRRPDPCRPDLDRRYRARVRVLGLHHQEHASVDLRQTGDRSQQRPRTLRPDRHRCRHTDDRRGAVLEHHDFTARADVCGRRPEVAQRVPDHARRQTSARP